MSVWVALIFLSTVAMGVLLLRGRSMVSAVTESASSFASGESSAAAHSTQDAAFETAETRALATSIFHATFSVTRLDYPILRPHLEVLEISSATASKLAVDERYFPRRPALLPKLLHALNADHASRNEIVRLLLQDATLAGHVLKRANSSFYRVGEPPTESIDRAVAVLGVDGLRAPVAVAAMQPMFQLPRGFFDQFAPLTWELSQSTALATEEYARRHVQGDAFVGSLLGLIGGLSRIVLFRLTLDEYRKHDIMPRAEVFTRVMQERELGVTRAIATIWELSAATLAAIDEQIEGLAPQKMSPLGRALYYGTLCGSLAVLANRSLATAANAKALLKQQGLDDGSFEPLWSAAMSAKSN
jgi:HD-like signal output (HDOD) protein